MGAAAAPPKPLRQRRNCVSLAVTRRRAPAFCPPLVPVSPPPAQASRMIDDPLFYLAAVPAVLIAGISKGGFGAGLGLLAVPMMALVLPPVQVAAIMLPILCVMDHRSEEHTSELQSLMRISYAVFCLKKKKTHNTNRMQYSEQQ